MNLYEFRIERERNGTYTTTSMYIVAPSMHHIIKAKMIEFHDEGQEVVAIIKHAPVCEIIKDDEAPYYSVDEDDIQITKTGEDIRPQVNFGEAVQVVDDLRFGDVMERDQLNVEFVGADEMMGQKTTHNWIDWNGGECPVSYETIVDVWFGDGTIFYGRKAGVWVWRDMDGAENKNGLIIAYRIAKADAEAAEQKIALAGSYRVHEPFGMRPVALFRPDLTSEEIAMLEVRAVDMQHELMENDGWIPWRGKDCPVDRDTVVDVKWGDGGITCGKKAWYWCWDNEGSTGTEMGIITAYRVVNDDPQVVGT